MSSVMIAVCAICGLLGYAAGRMDARRKMLPYIKTLERIVRENIPPHLDMLEDDYSV